MEEEEVMQLQGACTGHHAKVCNLCWYWRAKETGMLPLCWLGSLHSVAMYVNTTLLSLAFPLSMLQIEIRHIVGTTTKDTILAIVQCFCFICTLECNFITTVDMIDVAADNSRRAWWLLTSQHPFHQFNPIFCNTISAKHPPPWFQNLQLQPA